MPADFEVDVAKSSPRLSTWGGVGRAQIGEEQLVVVGRVFRLSESTPSLGALGPNAIAHRVLERWRTRGQAMLRDLVGDFLVCIVTPKAAYAFKSLTSPYQLYFDDARLGTKLESFRGPLDEAYLMRLLMVAPGIQHALEYTPFEGVRRLRPWHLLEVAGGVARQTQRVRRDYGYGQDKAQTIETAGRELADILDVCVQDRLHFHRPRTVCCEISGGLDSSFVAALAGRAKSGVRGYMFSYPEKPSHRPSERGATEVAERHGIDFEIVAPDDLPDGDLAEVRFDEPTDFFWYGPKFGSYTQKRTGEGGVVLTGYASDALFMRSPLILPHLLEKRRMGSFARELGRFSKLAQRSAVSIGFQSALSLLDRPTYLKLATPLAGRRANPLSLQDITADWSMREPISWLKRPQAELIEQQQHFDTEGRLADEALIGSGIVRDDSISYLAHRQMVISPWLSPMNIEEQSPYCDIRLFDFVYGRVRWDLVHGFDGPYKRLLREAQRGIVPDVVRNRSEDVFVFDGFRKSVIDHNAAYLSELLTSSPLVDPALFDRDDLLKTFEGLRFGQHSASIRSLYVLLGWLVWWEGMKNLPADPRS